LSKGRLLTFIGIGAVLLLALILGVTEMMERREMDRLVIPDEKTVAVERLAEMLTGPRSFQVAPGEAMDTAGVPNASPPAPHISPVAARRQVERIAKVRNFTAETSAKIHKLIDRLTETPKSRAIGEDHVNLLRLNLALDELK
jgi:hypothetical protein